MSAPAPTTSPTPAPTPDPTPDPTPAPTPLSTPAFLPFLFLLSPLYCICICIYSVKEGTAILTS